MNGHLQPAGEEIIIRSMRDEDIPKVQEIDRLSFTIPWPLSAYKYELHENSASLLWVAEADGLYPQTNVVGMIVVWLIVDEAHIATLAVLPEYRGRDIAKRLLLTALRTAIQKGLKIATLEVRSNNDAAINLYTAFGFEVVGIRPRYYRDNHEDALIMTLHGLNQMHLDRLEKSVLNSASGEMA
jgi:[ribosomal protein S18]-alanine N-acetyltransferase